MPSRSQVFTASGTFVVPDGVSAVIVTQVAGGAGAIGSDGNSPAQDATGGGGAGELCLGMTVPVVPGDSIAVVIGTGGIGAVGHNFPTLATDSSFGPWVVRAPQQVNALGGSTAGPGGGINGGTDTSANAPGIPGAAESPSFYGGGSGGGGNFGNTVGTSHGGRTPQPGTGGSGSGGGSAASLWGGPDGAATSFATANASAAQYGAGAGGDGSQPSGIPTAGGNGAPGYVLVQWIGPT